MKKEYKLKNGQQLIIRLAKKEDAAEFITYLNKVGGESDYLTFGGDEVKATESEEENYINYMLSSNNRLFLIAELEGKIVGSLSFTGGAKPRVLHTGEFGITILKDLWQLGIGSILIQELIDWAKGGGIVRKINLRVRVDNERAIKLYKRMGFQEEGIITRDFFMNRRFYDSILMGLKID